MDARRRRESGVKDANGEEEDGFDVTGWFMRSIEDREAALAEIDFSIRDQMNTPQGKEMAEIMLEGRVIDCRIAKGMTYAEIADEIGCSYSTVKRIITSANRRVVDEAGTVQYRAEALARLQRMMKRIWPKVDPLNPDEVPDLRYMEEMRALIDQGAKLTGAYIAPEKRVIFEDPSGALANAARMAEIKAQNVNILMDLLDRAAGGIGSGRAAIPAASEVVTDGDEART